ncbi:MAG: DUF3717 domain-containing protein [Orrella sp.]
MNPDITLTELESAINYWRNQSPSVGDELRLCPEAAALASPYAMMILQKRSSLSTNDLEPMAQSAIEEWLLARPKG